MNLRPSGYEPDELPGCSTPRQLCWLLLPLMFFLRLVFRVLVHGVVVIVFERARRFPSGLAVTYSPTS